MKFPMKVHSSLHPFELNWIQAELLQELKESISSTTEARKVN